MCLDERDVAASPEPLPEHVGVGDGVVRGREKTGDEGFSQPSGPSGKKTSKGLFTAVLAGALVLVVAAISIIVQSRDSKRQETTNGVSESESQEVIEKESGAKP